MGIITRDLDRAAAAEYDLIVVGGGIHGVMTALEAGRRNLKTLLLEKGDFGGATSYNSLRILHGGFRYLQNLDFQRVLESARERNWYQRHFPQLVRPMPCLFPLYGKGLRHPFFFGPALAAYNLLTRGRNQGLGNDQAIPPGRLIGRRATLALFPGLASKGLKGGGVWYDAFMPDSQRILVGCLKWAAALGVRALNYVGAASLIVEDGRVAGLNAIDQETGEALTFRSNIVVNAAGPWCRDLARRFHTDTPSLFKSMLAFNVLFDRPPVSAFAAAVTNGDPSAHTYFAVPWKGRLLVGTGQAPWLAPSREPQVTERQLSNFCNDLKRAMPGAGFGLNDIVTVYAGLQSADTSGGTEFTRRSIYVDHHAHGGPQGLFSISGVKFTTARRVAENALSRMIARGAKISQASGSPPENAGQPLGIYSYDWYPDQSRPTWRNEILTIAEQESVLHLDDLVLRRTSIGDNPKRALMLADDIGELMGWNPERREAERRRLERYYGAARPRPERPAQGLECTNCTGGVQNSF